MASTRIGVDNAYYALMTTEDTATSPPVYATPVRMIGLMTMNINPNGSLATLFADDGPFETAATLGNIDVEMEKNALTNAEKAALLGHVIDTNGALVSSSTDTPPWVAIGFRSLKANGIYRYVWLYKGRFVDPEDNNETKADTINWQTDTINGQFAALNNQYTVGGQTRKPYRYEIDAEDSNASASLISTWFQSVKFPS